ncbi:MAG: DinB family protein [Bacteroidota bacterium]
MTDTSSFARPPRYSAETARAYVEAIQARVGDRDPMPLLAAAPDALTNAVAGLDETDAHRQPDAGEWSVLQILHHLSDCEMVYGYRMRLIVAEERPAIPGFDQEVWTERLHYDSGTLADSLRDFRAQRTRTLRWLSVLSNDELARVGIHSERGEESVRDIVTLLAGHDLAHIAQIERTRAALGV